jgi:hypothetical protein
MNAFTIRSSLLTDWPALLPGPELLYLILAAICLLIALRFMRRTLVPIEALVDALVAAAVVAFTIGIALVLLVAAVLSGR